MSIKGWVLFCGPRWEHHSLYLMANQQYVHSCLEARCGIPVLPGGASRPGWLPGLVSLLGRLNILKRAMLNCWPGHVLGIWTVSQLKVTGPGYRSTDIHRVGCSSCLRLNKTSGLVWQRARHRRHRGAGHLVESLVYHTSALHLPGIWEGRVTELSLGLRCVWCMSGVDWTSLAQRVWGWSEAV